MEPADRLAFVIVVFVAAFLMVLLPVLGVLLLVCAYVAMLIAVWWVMLRYAMVNFILVDQGLTGMDAIKESKRLMQGNKGKLFTLQLSFVNWYLPAIIGVTLFVSIFTAGIVAVDYDEWSGVMMIIGSIGIIGIALLAQFIVNLWLLPYRTGVEARFYDWLTGRGINAQPPQFPHPPVPPAQRPNTQNYTYTWTDSAPSSGQGIGSSTESWSATWSGGSDSGSKEPKQGPGGTSRDDPWDRG